MDAKASFSSAEFNSWVGVIKSKRGWTDKDLADRSGLAPSTISRGRKSNYRFVQTMRTLQRIANASGEPIPPVLLGLHGASSASGNRGLPRRPGNKTWRPPKSTKTDPISPDPDWCVGLAVSANGDVTIPAALGAKLGVVSGDKLIGRVRDGKLILEPAETALRRAQDMVRRYIPNAGGVVEEFISERRAAAARE